MPRGKPSGLQLSYEPHLLTVRFLDGSEYEYFGVDPETYMEMLMSPSKGTYFNENIRGLYPENRVA